MKPFGTSMSTVKFALEHEDSVVPIGDTCPLTTKHAKTATACAKNVDGEGSDVDCSDASLSSFTLPTAETFTSLSSSWSSPRPLDNDGVQVVDEFRSPSSSHVTTAAGGANESESLPSPTTTTTTAMACSTLSPPSQSPRALSCAPRCSRLPPPPPSEKGALFPGEALGFSKEVSRAFSDGTLLPYFLSSLWNPSANDKSTRNAANDDGSCGTSDDANNWNGHLPLDPFPNNSSNDDDHECLQESRHVQWTAATRRARHQRRRHGRRIRPRPSSPVQAEQDQQQRTHSPHTIFPTTLSDPNQVEILFHSTRDLNDDSSNSPGSESSSKNSTPRIRRPPAASGSLSIPASNKPAVSANAVQAAHPSMAGGKKSPNAAATAVAAERVQVQTPGADRSALKELPALRDAPPAKREELFIMKLQLCSVIFTFDDPSSDKRGKDMKRQTLLELVDYVNTPAGQKIFTESVMGDLMACISANVCRALPPATDDFDPEEDEPVLEPAWPHLQVAYEFFLRFIVSSEVNAKAAKKYVDQKFCLQLVELFDSEDPRERDYLKTILHRIYGKFMSHRSFIRRAISNVFYRFVYETERHNGIGELLEILGSIINGFAIPLKKEHLQFLVRALIPLHKPKCVALYHQQLSYCIIQYVEKDADTAIPILNGFFKCWPWSCSGKQVMFLNELEEILELLGADQLAQVSTMLFTNLARCLDSDHFQVVERALFLWNNEHLVNSGCLSRLNAQTVLPIIYGPLYKNSSGHWNATVEGLAQNVLKMYMEYDLVLYDKCTTAYFREEEEAKRKLEAIENKWSAVEELARSNMQAISAK